MSDYDYPFDRRAEQSAQWMSMKMRPVIARAISRIGVMSDAQILAHAERSLDAIRRRSWLAGNSETDADIRDEYAPLNDAVAKIERAILAAKVGAP